SSAVRAVGEWRAGRLHAWRNLRRIAELIQTLSSNPEQGVRDLEAMGSDYHLPWELQRTLQDFAKRFATFAAQEQAATTIAGLADRLSGRADPGEIRQLLRKFAKDWSENLGPDTKVLLIEAVSSLHDMPQDVSPRASLIRWWRNTAKSLFSKTQFLRQRKVWASHVPREKFRELRTSDPFRVEYTAFREALGRVRIADDPTLAAAKVLAELAAYYEVPTGSVAWATATAEHRDHLAESLHRLRVTAPDWLV